MSNAFNFEDDEQVPFGEQPTEGEPGGDAPQDGSEGGNKNFMIAAIALGSIFLLTLLCAAGYFLLVFPKQQAGKLSAAQTATSVMVDAATSVAQTKEVQDYTPTLEPTATFTPIPTNTPVFIDPATATSVAPSTGGTGAPLAGGAGATQTQQSVNSTATRQRQMTTTLTPQGTSTSLAATGFADEVGLPLLLASALMMVAILFLARRLRLSQK